MGHASETKKTQLIEIEVLNFKSFEGHHYIGPFLDFTAIIGPNGGGTVLS